MNNQSLARQSSHVDVAESKGSVIDHFRKAVGEYPAATAIRHDGRAVTYEELDRRSDELAREILQMRGPAKEPVAALFSYGIFSIVALLGILKAGKFYSFVDRDLHISKQQTILSHLGASLILCDAANQERAAQLQTGNPHLSVLQVERRNLGSSHDCLPVLSETDVACIVYTSGSSGEPKGVVLSHRNIVFTALLHGHDFALTEKDTALHICPLWTVGAASEIFSALLAGATLIPFSIKEQGVSSFLRCIDTENLTTLTASPVLFRLLFGLARSDQKFMSVRLIRLGGDRTTQADLDIYNSHFGEDCLLRLGYGSSEFLTATQLFINQQYQLSGADHLPLGYPMKGSEILLLDDEGNEVSAGEEGEIVIKSEYLCGGYWRSPSYTARQFRGRHDGNGFSTYFTSDLGVRDTAGCLHFVGRKDSIIKVNGKMVSTISIQRALLGLERVKNAAVVTRHSKTRKLEIVAFLVMDDMRVGLAAVREKLLHKLPYEAMPSKVVALKDMPLTANNKIDLEELRRIAQEER